MGVLDDVRLLSVEEVAALMAISRSHVRNLCRAGKIPCTQILAPGAVRAKWLIPLQALKEFIAKNSKMPS